jgi:single-stranded DNA-binding protein
MLDPQNLVTIAGGLIADPEMVASGKIMKVRIGVDYAGSDKDSDNNSGYFDVVYYLKDNNGFVNKNANFVATQVESSKMKKGTTVSIIGRLVQERWKQDEQSRSRIVIVAEHMTYGQRSAGKTDGTPATATASASGSSSSAKSSVPESF